MSISENTASRLENYKFESARRSLENDTESTEDERVLVTSLSELFGNPGWFEGHLSVLIDAAIKPLMTSARADGEG